MPAVLPILPLTRLADEYDVKIWVLAALERGCITRNQWRAIIDRLASMAPVVAEMHARSPKSVVYLATDKGDLRLSARAKWT